MKHEPDHALLRRRFAVAVDAAEDRWCASPIVWGTLDCVTGAADVVREVLGFDPIPHFRGRWTTARGARRVLRREGFAALDDALRDLATRWGWPAIEPCDAQAGDVGIAAHPEGRTLMTNRGGPFWVAPAGYGLGVKPAAEIELAFAVLA